MKSRRAFLSGAAVFALGAGAGAGAGASACSPPLVHAVPNGPIAPDANGGAILVVIDSGRSRFGPIFFGSQQTQVVAGACVPLTHFIAVFPPGHHLIVAYDDESYDAAEADLAPYGIYALTFEHIESELEIHPLVPGRDPIRRLLDETDRVELARSPRHDDIETFQRKVRLAHLRYADYSARKRQARAIGDEHLWR